MLIVNIYMKSIYEREDIFNMNSITLENFINFCDEMQIAEESVSFDIAKYTHNSDSDKDKEYLEKVNVNFSKIVSELNKVSKSLMTKFIETLKKEYSDRGDYGKLYLDNLDKFKSENKSAPTITGIERSCNYVEVWFGGKFPSHDIELFYQDFIVQAMKIYSVLNKIGCKLESDDSIGIYIMFK